MVDVIDILWDLPFVRANGRPWFSPEDGAVLVRQFVGREHGLSLAGTATFAGHWADVSTRAAPPDHVGSAIIDVVRRCVAEGSIIGEPPDLDMMPNGRASSPAAES